MGWPDVTEEAEKKLITQKKTAWSVSFHAVW
jgi:hypothetical protein